MSILYINTGTGPNAGDGDSLRLAFTKINSNFRDLSNTLTNHLVDTDILSSGRYPLNEHGRVSLRVDNSQSPSFIVSNYVRDLRPEVMLRGWGTATAYISELAGGTVSTSTAVTTGSVIGSFLAGGYDGSRWSSDRDLFPSGLYFTAAENWAGTTTIATHVGTNVELNVHPPGIQLSTNTHQTIFSTEWAQATDFSSPVLTINFGNADVQAPLLISDNKNYNGISGTLLHYHHTKPVYYGVPNSSVEFYGSISGNILTVESVEYNPQEYKIGPGSAIRDLDFNAILTGTRIVSYLTGTGGTGTYEVNLSQEIPTSYIVSVSGDNFSIVGSNLLTIHSARGSNISGSRYALKENDILGGLTVRGQLVDSGPPAGLPSGLIYWSAREDFANSTRGTQVHLQTAKVGTSIVTSRLKLDNQENIHDSQLHSFVDNTGQSILTLTTASVTSYADLLPSEDLTYDLGSELKQWRNLYVRRGGIYVDGMPFVGGAAVSDTPPDNPTTGELWYNTDTGRLYVRYDTNWVDASPAGGSGGGGGGNVTYNVAAVFQDSVPPGSANSSTLWYDTVSGRSYVYYDDFWVEASPQSAGITVTTPPLHSTSTGFIGNIAYDSTYMYICVGTSTWKRVNLASDW